MNRILILLASLVIVGNPIPITAQSAETGWTYCVTEAGWSYRLVSNCSGTNSFATRTEAEENLARRRSSSKPRAEGWIVRAGVFSFRDQANERKAVLRSNGVEITIESFELNNQKKYRLYAGPFADVSVADRMAGRIMLVTGEPAYTISQKIYISESEPTTASVSTNLTQTAVVDKSALDLEFWQSIKDSNDPDMFNAYLRNYPKGAFIDLAKIKIQKLTGSTTSMAQASVPNLDYGNYHALVIGNNRYQNFKDLNTPINDARTVSRILQTSYGFKVDVLENATESEMFKAIVELRSNVGRNDNVLIYFGGHGELDRDTEEGFWIPSDARRDDPSTYIPVDRIRKQIKAMSAKHVMVVADSCFSGSLTRSILTRALKVKPRSPEYQTELQRIIDKKSRTALTSGGLEPVLDSGGDGHSVFASALISALRDNSGILDAHELFIQVRKKVRNNSPQDPEYSPIYETGHDHGDFLFVRR